MSKKSVNTEIIELKPIDVFVKVSVEDELPIENKFYYVFTAYSNEPCVREFSFGVFHNYDGYKVTHWLKEQKQQYVFSKEQLIELIRDAFYNGEEFGRDKNTSDCYSEDEYLRQLKLK